MTAADAAAAAVLADLRARFWRVAAAESCTGGLVMAALTEVPGASDVVDRGFVTYSNAAKIALLGVRETTLAAHGAVSEAVAAEMAEGALHRSDADVAVSVTGVAGPGGGSVEKPEGMVCIGLACRGRPTATATHQFGAKGRSRVRALSVATALGLIAAAARPAD